MTADLRIDSVRTRILERRERVLNLLSSEDVEVYLFLMARYMDRRGCIGHDHVFQFLYRSYYRLDNAGLTDDFKNGYFQMMERLHGAEIDLRQICLSLAKYRNKRNQTSLQFSFATKMAATIDPRLPIYDSFVAKMFDFRPPGYGRSLEQRLDTHLRFHEDLSTAVRALAQDDQLGEIRRGLADRITQWTSLTPEKQVDFILWSAGKAL